MTNLARVDLNLLVLFEALMAERNVTRAAARVGVAQPSASKALDRLRHLFGDPLFLRTPSGMRPTPRATELEPEIAAVLERVRWLVAERVPFDPSRAEGVIRVAMADSVEVVLLPRLLARLREAAPGLDLRARPLDKDRALEELDAGRLDAVIGVYPELPKRHASAPLYAERFVCLARRDHPLLAGGLTLDAYAELPHLLVTLRDDARGAVDEALARLGRSRRILAAVGRFLVVPHMLAGSDAVATVPSRFAAAAAHPGCAVHQPPLQLPGWTETLIWSRGTERAPLGAWFRSVLREVAGDEADGAGPSRPGPDRPEPIGRPPSGQP